MNEHGWPCQTAWAELREGLHSNIPLCCVVQYLWETYVVARVGRPPRCQRYHYKGSKSLIALAQYRVCAVHTWLLARNIGTPRDLYCCDGQPRGRFAVACPKCCKAQ